MLLAIRFLLPSSFLVAVTTKETEEKGSGVFELAGLRLPAPFFF